MKLATLNGLNGAGERSWDDGDMLCSTDTAADSSQAAANADDTSAGKQDAEDSHERDRPDDFFQVAGADNAYQSEKNNDRALRCDHFLTWKRNRCNRLVSSTLR